MKVSISSEISDWDSRCGPFLERDEEFEVTGISTTDEYARCLQLAMAHGFDLVRTGSVVRFVARLEHRKFLQQLGISPGTSITFTSNFNRPLGKLEIDPD